MQQNKAVARTWIAAGNDRDFDRFDAIFTADTVDHVSGNTGIAWWKEIYSWIGISFPDWRWRNVFVVGEGDLVMVRADLVGTHRGSCLPFLNGVEPIGTPIVWRHFHQFRLQDGLIAEHWAARDDLGVLRQLEAATKPRPKLHPCLGDMG
ncbi:ester cyclase [Kribbella sp. NPDC055071]